MLKLNTNLNNSNQAYIYTHKRTLIYKIKKRENWYYTKNMHKTILKIKQSGDCYTQHSLSFSCTFAEMR